MKLDQAIKILSEASRGVITFDERFKSACKLGGEALKLIQRKRLLDINPVEKKLPGETEAQKCPECGTEMVPRDDKFDCPNCKTWYYQLSFKKEG